MESKDIKELKSKRELRKDVPVWQKQIDLLKIKLFNFFDKVFDPPVKPYIYTLDKNLYYKFLSYFISEKDIYISKEGVFSFMVQVSQENLFKFIDYFSSLEFPEFSNKVLIQINKIEEGKIGSRVTSYYISFSWRIGFSFESADDSLQKFYKFMDFVLNNLKEKDIDFILIKETELIKILEDLIGTKSLNYDGTVPLTDIFPYEDLIIRDELFFSKDNIFLSYSLKSFLHDDINNFLKHLFLIKPPEAFFKEIDFVINTTVIIRILGERHYEITTLEAVKVIDGLKQLNAKDKLKLKKDSYGFFDFSDFVKEVDYQIIKAKNESGFVYQREQKNFSFIVYFFSIPMNFPNLKEEENLKLKRSLYLKETSVMNI